VTNADPYDVHLYVPDQVAKESSIDKCESLAQRKRVWWRGSGGDLDPDSTNPIPGDIGQFCVTLRGYDYDCTAERRRAKLSASFQVLC
jgi:hypothetical protein